MTDLTLNSEEWKKRKIDSSQKKVDDLLVNVKQCITKHESNFKETLTERKNFVDQMRKDI